MAKGYAANQVRLNQLSLLGKGLARRSKSSCELSLESGVPLKIYELLPASEIPKIERCLMVSDSTIHQLKNPKKYLKANQWRHLNELIWSDLPQVQIMALRILLWLGKDHTWAQLIIEDAFVDPLLLDQAQQAPLS